MVSEKGKSEPAPPRQQPEEAVGRGVPNAIFGLVFGAIFVTWGELWMLMCAHAAFDLTAYALICWELETTVARLVFR